MVTFSVPPAQYQEHYWHAHPDGMTGRRRLASASGLYESAVPAPFAEFDPQIPAELVADLDEATSALSKFDSYAERRLGRGSPTLGPMSSILLRTESASSSQIENLTVGARQLALAELDQGSSENASVVIGNVRAMEAALALAEQLNEESILSMHAVLLTAQPSGKQQAGRYRQELVWVGSSGVTPIGASHVGPQPELIRPAVADLMEFMRRVDLPPLLQAAIAHAQFETIHPFADGNGRTGRALVHALLRRGNILASTTAPVSAGLLRQTEAYFDALTAFRQGEGEPIVSRFVEASLFAAGSGRALVDALVEQLEQAQEALSGLRRDAGAWRILPHLVAQPVVDSKFLIGQLGFGEVAAQRALGQLAERGVLQERSGRRRNRVYHHAGILAVLDAYAQQLRRQ